MFGSDDLNVTGRRYVDRYAPDRNLPMQASRGEMVGWRQMNVTGSPVRRRSVPRGMTASTYRNPVVENRGKGPLFGLNVISEDVTLESLGGGFDEILKSEALKNILGQAQTGSATAAAVTGANQQAAANAAQAQQQTNSNWFDQSLNATSNILNMITKPPTQSPASGGGQTEVFSQETEETGKKPGFFSTPGGIAVIVGGGLVALLGVYFVAKKK